MSTQAPLPFVVDTYVLLPVARGPRPMGAELVRLTESSSPVTTALAFPPKAEPLARTPARPHARLLARPPAS